MLFGLQLLRVLFASFVSYLRDSQGVDALNLAPIALGTFAISFLSGLLRRVMGSRLAIWITAGGVGVGGDVIFTGDRDYRWGARIAGASGSVTRGIAGKLAGGAQMCFTTVHSCRGKCPSK